MARISIPTDLKGKDLINFVSANKEQLLAQKKAMAFKHADPFAGNVTFYKKEGGVAKAFDPETDQADNGVFNVNIVCNTALWMDSHSDVSLPDCWKKTIAERQGMILHLHDHKHTFEGEIGDVQSVYSMEMAWKDLGIDKAGKTQVLVMDSDVLESLNPMMYKRYRQKRVKQHSIGLQYIKIRLAINDEDSPNEYDVWTKWIDKIGNRDEVEAQGFFWALQEIKLYENSAVIFGSNELTPTLDTSTKQEPSNDTPAQPFDSKAYINNLKIKL